MRRRSLYLALVALLTASVGWAAPPSRVADVPIYPGAVLDKDATQEAVKSQASQEGQEAPVPGQETVISVYASSAAPEEVFNWYQKQLQATADSGDGAPGKVVYYADTYDPEKDFVSRAISDNASTDGALMKKSLLARPKTEAGWIKLADFSWTVKGQPNEASFVIEIEDRGFSFVGNKQQYKQGSRITVKSTFTK